MYGVAIPTTDGIRNLLDHIGAQRNGKQTQVLWINLREEPVWPITLSNVIIKKVNVSRMYRQGTHIRNMCKQ